MGRIFCIMGKSATGKDTVFQRLFAENAIGLRRIIPYTTRPIREGEQDGNEYFFRTDAECERLREEGRIIELRVYHTVYGEWKYFTADDGQIDLKNGNYLMIGTLEAYEKLQEYYGKENVLPIYIEVEDGERLLRAIAREQQQTVPKYAEMCRRFLADSEDFSEEKLAAAGINVRFVNTEPDALLKEITDFIQRNC